MQRQKTKIETLVTKKEDSVTSFFDTWPHPTVCFAQCLYERTSEWHLDLIMDNIGTTKWNVVK